MAQDFSWTGPVAVLAVGLGAGLVYVWRSRRGAGEAPATGSESSPDGATIADLERRYDFHLRRIIEETDPAVRASLEIEAAKTLRDLAKRREAAAASAAAVTAVDPARPQMSATAGFAWGFVTMASLGGLIYFAAQIATPRAEGGSPTGGLPNEGQAPAKSAELASLEEAVRANPRDFDLRIRLSRAYLERRDLMAVFEQTQAILETEPEHPGGLTYQALVRVAMGQPDMAEGMLTRAIAKDPDIVDAYIHLALARIQMGNEKGAEAAIRDAQKRFPQDAADLARVFDQMRAPAEGGPGAGAGGPSGAPAAVDPVAAGTGASITVRLELGPGVTVPSGAAIFVIVREAGIESGPPMAVKRLAAAAFPMTVSISDADSMAGESLPGLARVEARVDLDGDAASRMPDDPRAAADPVRPGGGTVVLVLKK